LLYYLDTLFPNELIVKFKRFEGNSWFYEIPMDFYLWNQWVLSTILSNAVIKTPVFNDMADFQGICPKLEHDTCLWGKFDILGDNSEGLIKSFNLFFLTLLLSRFLGPTFLLALVALLLLDDIFDPDQSLSSA